MSMTHTSNHQNTQQIFSKYLFVPFILLCTFCFFVFLIADINKTLQEEVENGKRLNRLLAQTASYQESNLTAQQVASVLKYSPNIESVMFYPINVPQTNSQKPFSWQTILIDDYFSVSEPVAVRSNPDNYQQFQELIGYMQMTLNIRYIRRQWFIGNLPIFISVFMVAISILLISLLLFRKLTKRFPKLEKIYQKIISNKLEDADLTVLTNVPIQQRWLAETVLLQLLNKQKLLQQQIQQLNHTLQQKNTLEQEQRLQSSVLQNTITHEFKISLNQIQSGIKLLQNQYVSHEQQESVELIEQGVYDLDSKLDQVIQLSRIERGQIGIHLEQFSPTQLIRKLADSYQETIQQKGLIFARKIYHADYLLEGDTQKINKILSALLENAIKFTEQGKITLTSQLYHLEKNIRWLVEVHDTGIGIAEKYHKDIFLPFFQVSPDSQRKFNDNRIGLALARQIACLMKGEITVVSSENKGSVFSLSLILDDWKSHYERTILKDKNLVFWADNQQEHHQIIYHKIQDAGAKVVLLSDEEAVFDYVITQRPDALLMSHMLNEQQVFLIAKRIRDLETEHRTIMIYDCENLYSKNLENLKIVGVDYIEPLSLALDFEEDYINHLVKLLG